MNQDTSKMSSEELRAMAAVLMKQAEEQSVKEFESTMNFLSDKLVRMGRTKKDAVIHLLKMMRAAEMESTLADLVGGTRTPMKERSDLDSHGKPPEVGVTYQLPTGETWSRKSKMGATKRAFAVHARTSVWESMKT
ncbi:hypothetical protein [Hydrogenophaga sp. BPS33]|uniref:hypothetical protein n=1 Tax=Hydrogenophaga sp. BPS33 TaxID=2651974 RepID=UPI00131F59A1|nr:hypothetical protein [Hydrogenophaga sp. BPS33]QHE87133.1 hypothetical protein F9K07_20640 [Hydrogenophaga sp. BPS33]